MKKIRIFLLTILIFAMSINLVNAEASIGLTDIANAFNERDDIQLIEQMGLTVDAIADEANSTLTIEASDGEETFSEVYTLNGNILSTTVAVSEDGDSSMWTSVFDTIGILHGYEEGETLLTLESDEFMDYTLANEGAEINDPLTGSYTVSIDITKKLKLIDLNNIYIKPEDLEDMKDELRDDESWVTLELYNLEFQKDNDLDGNPIITIGEVNGLTERAYKSLLSIIEVIFDSTDVVNYFKESYPKISGNVDFTGFKVEIGVNTDEIIDPAEPVYEYMRVTINKSEAVSGKPATGNGEPSSNPKTADASTVFGNIILIFIGAFSVYYLNKKSVIQEL